jgi:hypothetical protein
MFSYSFVSGMIIPELEQQSIVIGAGQRVNPDYMILAPDLESPA